MKKRLKADNVEQLMEIVQAVQRGEDTETIAAKRAEQKKQEAEAAARAEQLERERRRERRNHLIGKIFGKEDWEDEEAEEEPPEESGRRPAAAEGTEAESGRGTVTAAGAPAGTGRRPTAAERTSAGTGSGRASTEEIPESIGRDRMDSGTARSSSGRSFPESGERTVQNRSHGQLAVQKSSWGMRSYDARPDAQDKAAAADLNTSTDAGRPRNRRTATAYERWIEEEWQSENSGEEDFMRPARKKGLDKTADKTASKSLDITSDKILEEALDDRADKAEAKTTDRTEAEAETGEAENGTVEDREDNGPKTTERIRAGLKNLGRFLKRALSDDGGRSEETEKPESDGEKSGSDGEKPGNGGGKSGRAGAAFAQDSTLEKGSAPVSGPESEVHESKSGTSAAGHFQFGAKRKNGTVGPGRVRRSYTAGTSGEAEAVGRRILRSLNMESDREEEETLDPETERTLDRIISRIEEERSQEVSENAPVSADKTKPAAASESGDDRESQSGGPQSRIPGRIGSDTEGQSGGPQSRTPGRIGSEAESQSGESAQNSIAGQTGADTESQPGTAVRDSANSQAGADTESRPGTAVRDSVNGQTGADAEGRNDSTDRSSMDGSARPDAENHDAGHSPNGAEKRGGRPRLSDCREPEEGFDPRGFFENLSGDFRLWLKKLEEKGVGRRELLMLGAGAVLAVLVIVLIGNGIAGTLSTRRKQKYVTADEGLTVTVEQQPDAWSSSAEIKLKFSAKNGVIQTIRLNGEAVQQDELGIVTAEAQDCLLNAEAVLEDGSTLTAQIEFPKIDAEAPEVTASKSGSQVTLTAEDARSGVEKIRYAAVKENAYFSYPQYQDYTEPFTVEDGYIYYFYAEDYAGNRSELMRTTFATAEALTFSGEVSEALMLFPGETVSLAAAVQPEGSLLTNLKYESSDASVAEVDNTGYVKAAAAGSAVISASADGVAPISCIVEVTESRTVTISAVGDCTIGTDEYFNTTTNFDAYYSVNGASWFFQNVRDILGEDDVTFANLEGTLTTETARENKEYAFKGDPAYTEILQDGSVEVVSLANNHSSDYGAQSLTDTEQYLTDAGIDYCIGDTVALREVNGITTAFIGIYELADGLNCETQLRAAIAKAQEQGAQLIITAFHWGTESSNTPDDTQISLAHTAIDCGADLVVGHHPHVLQGIEKYNGKYIVYSLGNFCFGGNSSPSDTDTMIFRQTFTIRADGVQEDDAIEIIPCSITSGSGYNNYQPTPATGEEADRIMSRINEYSAAFGTTVYTASAE